MKTKLYLSFICVLVSILAAGTASAQVNGAPCVFGSDSAFFGNRATVVSDVGSNGSVEVQNGDFSTTTTIQGDIEAGSWVRIGGPWSEVGDVTAGQWIDVQQGAVTGYLSAYTYVPTITLPTRYVPVGTRNYYLQNPPYCDQTIPPGNYNEIYVNQGCRLTLIDGVYNVARLTVQADAELEIAGTVQLNARWGFTFGDRAELVGADDPTTFQVYSGGNARIGTNTEFRGMVLAPNDQAEIGNYTDFAGCLQGKRIVAQTDVNISNPADTFCNPELNSVISAHGNTDWHIDTANEFLFGVDMNGNPTATNHVPNTWDREHIHIGAAGSRDFYYDSTLNANGQDTNDPDGIDRKMLFFYAGHGHPEHFDALGESASFEDNMSLGNCDNGGSLRYYWQCSCEVFAHGPRTCAGGGWAYSCPEDFDGSADSEAHRNVYDRWGPIVSDGYLRMACGSSTSAYCHEDQANRIWNNYNNLGFDVADSFIFGLHSDASYDNVVVPLCITTGGDDVTQTPLYDQTFTNAPNFGGDNYYIQFLSNFATNPVSASATSSYSDFAELPVYEVLPATAPAAGKYQLDDSEEIYVSKATSQDQGPQTVIFKKSGAVYYHGQKKSLQRETKLTEKTYKDSAGRFVSAEKWKEKNAEAARGERMMIERASLNGEPLEQFQKNISVSYRRKMDVDGKKIPVVGSGGQILVQLNNDGSVLNASKVWRNVKKGSMKTLKPFDEAMEEAIAQLENADAYTLDTWKWGYKEEAGTVEQKKMSVVLQFAFKAAESGNNDIYPPRMIEIAAQ
jgi:hypothetical protein